jgi:FMN phosphatase YigB (HAD superfamily)
MKELKTEAKFSIMVGNSLRQDILPAKSIGMKTIWLCASGSSKEADYKIKNLVDLKKIL